MTKNERRKTKDGQRSWPDERRPARLAVIGHPVAHSLSPLIQNAALKALGLPFTYKKIHVTPNELKTFIRRTAPSLAGFNITLPHKEKIIGLLDWVCPKAKRIGAVNTVVRYNSRLLGFNTDGDGYLQSLKSDQNFYCSQKNILVLGAGGAARALGVALGQAGARRIVFANRTVARAQKLSRDLKKFFKRVSIAYSDLDGYSFHKALRGSDLLINTTSVGLEDSSFNNFPWQHLSSRTLVSDIVYRPLLTPFLKEARKRGNAILTGEGMLVYQGALSFLLWTGHSPDTDLMRHLLLKKLKKKN